MKKKLLIPFLLILSVCSYGQILGGGTLFSNAVTVDQSWISTCTSFSNQVGFEPTTAMDACAPAPACATGTTGSDVWFAFIAHATTATIVVAPSASFDCAIQAFSGTACPGLTTIGCADAGGNNVTETMPLTGLTVNTKYYFRVFGATSSVANRTGTYTICGSTGLGSFLLPVTISRFTVAQQNNNVLISWVTESESVNSLFEIERSNNASQYETIGKVTGQGTTTLTTKYSFTDNTPLTATAYYRLKQVDIDGRFKYSSVAVLKAGRQTNMRVQVLPNLVSGNTMNLSISSTVTSKGIVRIINPSGQSIYQQTEQLVKGENIFRVNNLPSLSNGVYTLQVITGNEIVSTRFISSN